MNTETGQSEDTSKAGQQPAAASVEENGVTQTVDGATLDGKQGHTGEGEQGEHGEKQGKSANRNARRRRLQKESETEKAQLREDNRKLTERLDTLESQVDGVINPPAARPQRVNFDSEEEYEDELHAWRNPKPAASNQPPNTLEQPAPAKAAAAEPGKSAMSVEVQKVVDDFNDSVDDAADKYDDFNEVTKSTTAPMTDIMRDSMIESSNGGEVLYHLAKNPAEAVRISKLPLARQVTEISEINKKFASSTTGAPDPIETIKSGSSGSHKTTSPLLEGATFE